MMKTKNNLINIGIIICFLFVNNIFAQQNKKDNKINLQKNHFPHGKIIKGEFYYISEEKKRKDKPNEKYWKFENQDHSFAIDNNQVSLLIYRFETLEEIHELMIKYKNQKKIKEKEERFKDKSKDNKDILKFYDKFYDNIDEDYYNVVKVYVAIIKKFNVLIVNKNIFDREKRSEYISYKLPSKIIDNFLINNFKTVALTRAKENYLKEKTSKRRSAPMNHMGWLYSIRKDYKSFVALYNQESHFKPFKYTNGKIEVGFEKPKYWDYESFQAFKDGWNKSLDQIHALIDKAEKSN